MSPRLLLLAVVPLMHDAWAAETCRYSGTSSYSGRISVETTASAANGETTVNVAARVDARMFGLIDWRYLYQEIGVWRGGELLTIGVNHRYSVLGSLRRQQWDVFRRTEGGMQAWRVQAKTLADLQQKHPGFVSHWDPERFGEDWLPAYRSAPPERRADLDLPAPSIAPGLGIPLTMAFYWVRWAGTADRTVPLFLPGFKRDMRADVPVVSRRTEPSGLPRLHAEIRHRQLSESKVSTGDAWLTADHHLARVTFDAHSDHGSAHGDLRLDGCQGEPPPL